MSIEENVQIVKDWFAAVGSEVQRLQALSDKDIEWGDNTVSLAIPFRTAEAFGKSRITIASSARTSAT
jgi:hypothetical protein